MADNIDITGTKTTEFNDSIKIADDVIRCIAAIAVSDIEGVAGMAGTAGNEIKAIFGGKSLDKGVRMTMEEKDVRLVLSVVVKYGCNIPDVSRKIQDKVRTTIENMTGFTVSEIDVNIAGIKTDSEEN